MKDVMMYVVLSVSDFGGFTGPSGAVTVNVTTADDNDEVVLECEAAESNPPPNIIVELSYIAGAGVGISPFVLDECRRSGSTLTANLTLVPGAGGVIRETIPRAGETIPQVADSVTFQVSCVLFGGSTRTPCQATITVQGM